jgi:MerR family transcriptional regulator, thiopeptide resistance regulator
MKLLKIGEIAKCAGVTVRTLHYYEEIGLLVPDQRTDAGHRVYGRGSIERLQQIRSLQQLGLSLTEVGALLRGADVSPRRIVANHLAELAVRREALDRLEAQLCRLAVFLDAGADDDAEAVTLYLETLETMSMYDKYLSQEQIESVKDAHAAAASSAEAEWNASLAGLRDAMNAGTDPADPKVKSLVERWHEVASAFLPGDDESVHEGVMKALHEEPQALADHGLDAELFGYIGRAAAPTKHG